jgi:hypothetical protein
MKGTLIAVFLIILTAIFLLIMIFGVILPAQKQYNDAFGADVNMATQGATTLTGPNSIQYYVNIIWANMNQTFNPNTLRTTYNTPWGWDQTYQNSLAAENSYLNTLNVSITQRQAMVDKALQTGNYLIDPVQNAINQTRQEMNAYGGLDWAIHDAWYLQNASFAYWAPWYLIIIIIVGAIMTFLAFILSDD